MALYLNELEIIARLSIGKSVAQFLSAQKAEDYTILKWFTIGEGEEKPYSLYYHEVFDEGDEHNLNLFDFSPLDPEDLPFGLISEFETIEEVLIFAENEYYASPIKYVPENMINEEYAKYLKGEYN